MATTLSVSSYKKTFSTMMKTAKNEWSNKVDIGSSALLSSIEAFLPERSNSNTKSTDVVLLMDDKTLQLIQSSSSEKPEAVSCSESTSSELTSSCCSLSYDYDSDDDDDDNVDGQFLLSWSSLVGDDSINAVATAASTRDCEEDEEDEDLLGLAFINDDD